MTYSMAALLGKGTVGSNIAYVISGSKLIFMQTSTSTSTKNPEIYIVQK